MTDEITSGPLCDGCGEEFAMASLMTFSDYNQVRIGLNCAPNFLRTIADSIDGKATAESEPGITADEVAAIDQAAGELTAAGDPDAAEAPEQGSARDHWASTTHVRRSTHGHRGGRSGATSSPADET